MSNPKFGEYDITSGDPIYLVGFDDAIIGTALCHGNDVHLYSMKKMVSAVMRDHNMSNSEATDFLIHNTWYAYFGETTPAYLDDLDE
jgi:hypothetical protein